MRKLSFILAFMIVISAGSFANGFDYQVGIGGSGHFIPEEGADPGAYPLGFGVYGGIGYPITPDLAVGLEYEFSSAYAFDNDDKTLTLHEHLPKAYIRFYSYENFALTGLMGLDILAAREDGINRDVDTGYALGFRVSLHMGYGQYTAVFTEDRIDHRLGFGLQVGNLILSERTKEIETRNRY